VLALAADAPAARQQALLDVLTEARLGELDPAGREDLDDLNRGDAVGVDALDRAELLSPSSRARVPVPPVLGDSSSRRRAMSTRTGRRGPRNGTMIPVGDSASRPR